MSTPDEKSASVTLLARRASREVVRVVRGREVSDGAGVRLTRVIGGPDLPDLDPFLLFDEFGSAEASDYIAGFPDHPHRGFETVTYMLAGRMRHRDNQGNSGLLTPGSVQWMTAGRGIVHSEMPEQERGLMRGFQLWVNLPARDKLTTPRYQDILPSRVPELEPVPGVRVRLLAGTLGDVAGPVGGVATEPVYLDVRLDGGTRFEAKLPEGHAAFCYVYEGRARVGPAGRPVSRGELAVLGPGSAFAVAAESNAQPRGDDGARLVLIAGRPLGEPVVRYGPFVMNTRDEIAQAFADFQSGRF
jgi:quercetin 2,3-dioxygenase